MQWLQDTFTALTTSEASTSGQEPNTASLRSPKELQTEGQLSKDQVLVFFEEASKHLRSEEYRRKLKDAFLLNQVGPGTIYIILHTSLECLAVCPAWLVSDL